MLRTGSSNKNQKEESTNNPENQRNNVESGNEVIVFELLYKNLLLNLPSLFFFRN